MLESQERELESRRSSMMTMEVLLTELNAERAAKNEEIQRLKVYVWNSTAESSCYTSKVNHSSSSIIVFLDAAVWEGDGPDGDPNNAWPVLHKQEPEWKQ